MNASIGRLRLKLRASAPMREAAAVLARDVRSALSDALETVARTTEATGATGVVLVPRMQLSLSAKLGRVRGRDIARALARASFDAAVQGSLPVTGDSDRGAAQQIVERLRAGESVRCASRAEAAAAWLVALVMDDPGMLRAFAPFADLRHRSSGAAFAQICARTGDARGVVAALGRRWSLLFASRCGESEAACVLHELRDDIEPVAETWAFLSARLAGGSDGAQAHGRRVLGAAVEGMFERQAGIAAAARTLLAAASAPRREPDAPQASNLTGVWLLWAHLGPYIGAAGDFEARAIALALAQYVGAAPAADDAALAVLCAKDESLRDLYAAVPPTLKLDRLAASVVRDFARTLRHFERARCGYVLHAILSGPGTVWSDGAGWRATLPHSPLRIVLDRASLLGPLALPWRAPRLTLVPDDD